MKIAAPAKINLGLRVVGRRRDGYHELDAVFLPLDLADELLIETTPAESTALELVVEGDAPAGDDNLALRAARAFVEAAGRSLRVRILLRKRTPAAAGLGGGSSDAGAVLRALARQYPGAVPGERLAGIALGLGADVPFFLAPRPARVRGIGECIDPLKGIPPLALLLANPGVGVPTTDVYRAQDALGRPASKPRGPLPDLRNLAGAGDLTELVHNDLEEAAVRVCPAIAGVRSALARLPARAIGLSGSGGTLYGLFDDPEAAVHAARQLALPEPGWWRVAVTLESG